MPSPLPFVLPRREPLTPGRLLRRYQRFLADVELADGTRVTAHCVNTGAMEGLTEPGLAVWLSPAANPHRKLRWTWELVEKDGVLLGADASYPNRLVRRLLLEGPGLPWLGRADEVRPERRLGRSSRADFWLRRGRRETWVEVKNCHLAYPDGRAYFPDAVTRRGTGHLEELARAAAAPGVGAHVLFVCQFPGARAIRPSDVHDPTFAATARRVAREGVRFSALEVVHTPETVAVTRRIPVELRPYPTAPIARFRAEAGATWGERGRPAPRAADREL